MLDFKTLQKYDSKRMHEIYNEWPKIAKEAYNSHYEIPDFKDIEHIVFAGMGGSGTIGDVFFSLLSKSKIHVNVVKGFLLPTTINSNTLVVTTSISGNTLETLSVLDSARKIGCKMIAFSSGGKMEEYCNRQKIEYRKIPALHSPRESFTKFTYSILKVLEPSLAIKNVDIVDSIKKLKMVGRQISSYNLTETNPALKLAQWISGIPVIYYPCGLYAAATRFKNSLQENSKIHAMIEDVVEGCHNGIVAWEKRSNVQPILLRGQDDHVTTKKRWKIFKEYFKKNNIDYSDIVSIEGSILTKIINLIYLLDYSTIYHAVLSGVDPFPVNSIHFIKKRL